MTVSYLRNQLQTEMETISVKNMRTRAHIHSGNNDILVLLFYVLSAKYLAHMMRVLQL